MQIEAANILDGLGDAVIFVDAELRVVYLNEVAQARYGVDRDAAVGQRLDALYEWVWDDPAHENEAYDRLNHAGEWRGLNRHRLRDGRELIVESTVRTLSAGAPAAMVAVIRDVTAQHEQAEALAAALDQVRRAHAGKIGMISDLSSELRDPLYGVFGLAAALEATSLTAQQREILAEMTESSAAIERLLSGLLDAACAEAGVLHLDRAPTRLGEMLRLAVRAATPRALECGVRLNLAVAPEAEGAYLADASRIQQVVDILVANAFAFTSSGAISLALDVAPLDEGAGDQRERVVITVADTGKGFDEAELARLLDRFSQAPSDEDPIQRGAGLRLAIGKALVAAMGGEIQATSRPSAGSVFTVRLPLAHAPHRG